MNNIISDDFRFLMRKHQTLVQNYLSTLNLYMGQPRMLFQLKENPNISQSQLSDILKISKEATSVSIRRLERNGFIERTDCVDDRRIKILKLSESGQKVVKELRKNFDEINSEMFTDLSNEELKELKRMIKIMDKSLEKRLEDEKII